ncbi:Ltp family lipoprotein [Anaerostipes sp.]|uniref:Ltp family lipoprotein n=1 Tax=Anaerostipes sp. TaxID=1872530 RepID=UPI0025C739AA|nr:Ltp family lipoprotein [Anaerostipes sp.]MBS7008406.1 Ltp family lipoprotein [Anaerostipes sp.]
MKKRTLIAIFLTLSLIILTSCRKNETVFGDGASHKDLLSYIHDLTDWDLEGDDLKNSSFSHRGYDYSSDEKIESISDNVSITYETKKGKEIINAVLDFEVKSKEEAIEVIGKIIDELGQNYSISSQKIRNYEISNEEDDYNYDKLSNDEDLTTLITNKIESKDKIVIEAYYNPSDSSFEKILLDIAFNDGTLSENYNDAYIHLKIKNDPNDSEIATENYYGDGNSTTYEEDYSDDDTSLNDYYDDEETTEQQVTAGERNALDKAYSYLNTMAFSKSGLIEQLEYEGFTKKEAKYAVDNCGANWKEQAAKKAEQYLRNQSFSRSGLIEQLEYEGFTSKQARYGVKKAYK